MVDDVTRQYVMLMFRARDFESMWYVCQKMYDDLGFKNQTDQQMINEFKWIVQQLRKYMFSKQDDLIALNSVDDMIALVDDWIAGAEEYGDERRRVAYNFLRDHWLFELRNHLVELRLEMQLREEPEDYEEAEDEWAE